MWCSTSRYGQEMVVVSSTLVAINQRECRHDSFRRGYRHRIIRLSASSRANIVRRFSRVSPLISLHAIASRLSRRSLSPGPAHQPSRIPPFLVGPVFEIPFSAQTDVGCYEDSLSLKQRGNNLGLHPAFQTSRFEAAIQSRRRRRPGSDATLCGTPG